MGQELEFLILGPLEVRAGGRQLTLRTAKQRALLAILLVHANEVVSADRLIDELWGQEPPRTVSNTLQVYLSQLRKLLEAGRGGGGEDRVLVRRAPGYMLRVGAEQLDSVRFERLVAVATEALESSPTDALATFGEALAFWRGPALAEFAFDDFARPEIARLQELRLAAIEGRVEARLALGRHAAAVGELEALAAEFPLRERLRGQLMLALYRCGRQAEALDVYQKTREALIEGLGIEPSPALQRLERAILNQDPSLEREEARASPPAAAAVARSPSATARRAKEARKPVTAVSVELALAGSARGKIDPELLARALPRAHEAIARILESHGGAVRAAEGGEVSAVFGIPEVHEDDPLRAVRAAVEIRDLIEQGRADPEPGFDAITGMRAGIATGEVLAGATPETVVGTVASVAARLRTAAASGEIVIAEATRRLLRDATEMEALEPIAFPLTGEAVPAWRLLRVFPGAAGVRRRLETPLVGRGEQLELLTHAFGAACRERRAQLVSVVGPAGIGKTRLARELIPLLAEEARIVQGRCPAYGEGVSLLPLVEIVRQVVGDTPPREEIRRILASEAEADLISDRLSALIGISESTGDGETTSWAMRKFLEALSRERPLVVVLDDLHWAEPTLLDLVDYVLDWAADAPILIVCLGRPELLADRPAWSGGRRQVSSLVLEPLTDSESETLLELLAGEDLQSQQRRRIMAAAAGNPLFLEQMLALGEEASGAEAVAVPPTIQGLLAARLDRLEPEQALLLETASVIGEEFWQGALAELAGPGSESVPVGDLRGLIRRDLIEPCPSSIPDQDALRFCHVLIREAAYERLPKRDRAGLHERFAGWLEQREGEREEITGYHLERAFAYRSELGLLGEDTRELGARACSTLASAGMRARRRGDSRGSVSLLARAVVLVGDGHPGRGELLLHLAEELLEVGDFHWADAVIDETEALADKTGAEALKAHVLVLRLRHQLQIDPGVDTNDLAEAVRGAIDVFASNGDERGQARAWTVLSWIPWIRCRANDAEAALRCALEHARRAGDDRTEYECLSYLLGTALFGPLPVPEGIKRTEAALDHPSKLIQTAALRTLAVLRAMEGNHDEARRLIRENKTLLNDLGLRYLAASATSEHGSAEMLIGDLDAAERELREGYAALEEMGEASGLSTVAALLAAALAAQGKAEEALRFADTSETHAAGVDLQTLIPARRARARALAALGQLAEAEAVARQAVELAQQTDWLNLHADALMTLAYVLWAGHKAGEAADAAEEALQLYEQKGNAASAARGRTALATTFVPS